MYKTILMITGSPCSGKSTLVDSLAQSIECPVISMGDIARSMAEDLECDISEICPPPSFLCKFEQKMRDMLEKSIIEMSRSSEFFIIDGFPRFSGQVDWLRAFLKERPEFKAQVLVVDADRDELIRRMHERGRESDTVERLDAGIELTRGVREELAESKKQFKCDYFIL